MGGSGRQTLGIRERKERGKRSCTCSVYERRGRRYGRGLGLPPRGSDRPTVVLEKLFPNDPAGTWVTASWRAARSSVQQPRVSRG